MKISHEEFIERFAAQTRPVNFHIGPESVARFRKDDRIWTIEV